MSANCSFLLSPRIRFSSFVRGRSRRVAAEFLAAKMRFSSDYNLRMASFKIRWKRRPFKRSASLTSVAPVGRADAKGVESYCEDAADEWEFVTKTDVVAYPSRRNSVSTSTLASLVDDDNDRLGEHPSAALTASLAKSESRPRPRSWLGALSQPFISEEPLSSLDCECK